MLLSSLCCPERSQPAAGSWVFADAAEKPKMKLQACRLALAQKRAKEKFKLNKAIKTKTQENFPEKSKYSPIAYTNDV